MRVDRPVGPAAPFVDGLIAIHRRMLSKVHATIVAAELLTQLGRLLIELGHPGREVSTH